MAHTDEISQDQLKKVAREIGEFIDSGLDETVAREEPVPDEETAPLALGETLTTWKLTDEAFKALDESNEAPGKSDEFGDFSKWVEPTRLLYHQILLRGTPEGFARSYREPNSESEALVQLAPSPFAAKLEELFKAIDENRDEDQFIAADPVVRLLEIPPYGVFALWLFSESLGESRVMIISAAKRLEGLIPGGILNPKEFIDELTRGGTLVGVI